MPSQQTNMQKGYPTPKKNSQKDSWVQGNEPKRPVNSKLQNNHLSLLKAQISLPDNGPAVYQARQLKWGRGHCTISEKGWPLIQPHLHMATSDSRAREDIKLQSNNKENSSITACRFSPFMCSSAQLSCPFFQFSSSADSVPWLTQITRPDNGKKNVTIANTYLTYISVSCLQSANH